MNIDRLREYCRTFPNVSENIQWGNDLVLKIGPKQGGKMFAVACLDASTPVRYDLLQATEAREDTGKPKHGDTE